MFVFIGKTFCDLFLLGLFFIVFRMVREMRGRKGKRGEDAQSVKYESIELCCSQRIIIRREVIFYHCTTLKVAVIIE